MTSLCVRSKIEGTWKTDRVLVLIAPYVRATPQMPDFVQITHFANAYGLPSGDAMFPADYVSLEYRSSVAYIDPSFAIPNP
jgi:hypothetical protein